jgi:hypothetical protein
MLKTRPIIPEMLNSTRQFGTTFSFPENCQIWQPFGPGKTNLHYIKITGSDNKMKYRYITSSYFVFPSTETRLKEFSLEQE